MESVKSIEDTKRILLDNSSRLFNRLYYSSNEDIEKLFSKVDMKDKKILTVLASGDQLFHIYERDPKSVDTFDINGLTKYYYYLRKWSIIYNGEYYFDIFDHYKILDLLQKVKVENDEEFDAYCYWNIYINSIPPFLTKDLFYRTSDPYKNRIRDLKRLREALVNNKFSFNKTDIVNDDLSGNYDLIITSNIIEYYNMDRGNLDRIRDNLFKSLNEDGKVLSTYFMESRSSLDEISSFKELFDKRVLYDRDGSIGCVYKKKRC